MPSYGSLPLGVCQEDRPTEDVLYTIGQKYCLGTNGPQRPISHCKSELALVQSFAAIPERID